MSKLQGGDGSSPLCSYPLGARGDELPVNALHEREVNGCIFFPLPDIGRLMAESKSQAPDLITAEQRARELLAQRQWRPARDELKKLTKLDRPRFLPLLIRANIGLSREMTAKGQVAEAQQVLSYLAGIASIDELRAAEQDLTAQSAPDPAEVAQLADKLFAPDAGLLEAERLKLADKLILGFQGPRNPRYFSGGAGHPGRAIGQLASTVRSARGPLAPRLAPVSVGALGGLYQRRGRFPHRQLGAGFAAAEQPAGWDRAGHGQPILPALAAPAAAVQDERTLEGACRLLGKPGAGRVLAQADRLWREEDYSELLQFDS